MNIRKVAMIAAAVLLAGLGMIFYFSRTEVQAGLDGVAVNDIAQSLAEQWPDLVQSALPGRQYGLDYVVLNNEGQLIEATRPGLNENLAAAVAHRDTIVDVIRDGNVLGKLIIYNPTGELWKHYRNEWLTFMAGLVALAVSACLAYAIYLDRSVFRPFRRLQSFARHVAAGNLDIPLAMDRSNKFGAFTESFDLMREELAKARENERSANQSKKELVASLSHDIKTPVASIKAISELLIVKSADRDIQRQVEVINAKADQINHLITNLFNATLEELQELKVSVTEEPSSVLYDMIENADYNHRAVVHPLPECLIVADSLRLAQVVDNVIGNSYKYADTRLNISVSIQPPYLMIEFRDYGPGVDGEELPLLLHKFYRAGNAAGKNGAGLGLYISQYLMEKMAGEIVCNNTEDGFAVSLKLPLA